MNYQEQAIAEIAAQLKSHGYTVYLAKDGMYGFYTDGKRVVSFGSSLGITHFSGSYKTDYPGAGSGWRIADGLGSVSAEAAKNMIEMYAPSWATRGATKVQYTTPEQYLKKYQESSGFNLFGGT